MLKYFLLLLVVVTFVASCSTTSNPTGPGTTTYVQPKAGSSFTYDQYNTDTTAGLPVPGTRDTLVQTYAQTGISFMGRTNVTKLVNSKKGITTDSSYINFESNGDVSAFVPFGGSTGKWILVPSGSKSSNSTIFVDTVVTIAGVSTATKITLSTAFIDDETMTVKGQSMSVTKLNEAVVNTQTITPPGVPSTQTQTTIAYFAPSLGNTAKEEKPVVTGLTGKKSQGHVKMLIDYTLQ